MKEQKFEGRPVVVVHFDKDGKVTSREFFNRENFVLEKWQVESLARTLLPMIRDFYSKEENVRAFEEWKKTHRTEE